MVWVRKWIGRLSALFDEPAAFSEFHPNFEPEQFHELIGFNSSGSVWLSDTELVVRDLLGNVVRRVPFELSGGTNERGWTLFRTHLQSAGQRYALLGSYISFDSVRLLRINLENFECVLMPKNLPVCLSHNFSPDASYFFWLVGEEVFRRPFDLDSMDLPENRKPTQLTTLSSSETVAICCSWKKTGCSNFWRSCGALEAVSTAQMKEMLADESLPDRNLHLSIPIHCEELENYDFRVQPIVLASQSLRNRSLAILANCSSEQKCFVRDKLPDPETRSIFDEFHVWWRERASDHAVAWSQNGICGTVCDQAFFNSDDGATVGSIRATCRG
jgi:hypothetical protein